MPSITVHSLTLHIHNLPQSPILTPLHRIYKHESQEMEAAVQEAAPQFQVMTLLNKINNNYKMPSILH